MLALDEVKEGKAALDAARPLPVRTVAALADWFEVELCVTCALVEGRRLTRKEVMMVLDKGTILRNRPVDHQRLVLNNRSAAELLARLSFTPGGTVTERTICAFHGLLFGDIDRAPGRYREGPLRDGGPGATPDPAKLRVSMSALSGWLRRAEPGVDTAFEAHHRLMAVRPFDDGNHTVALYLCNLILNRAGFPPVLVREGSLDAYLEGVQRASALGDKGPFREVMSGLLLQSLEVCLAGRAGVGGDEAEDDAPPARPASLPDRGR